MWDVLSRVAKNGMGCFVLHSFQSYNNSQFSHFTVPGQAALSSSPMTTLKAPRKNASENVVCCNEKKSISNAY